jgi:hypothetical protein
MKPKQPIAAKVEVIVEVAANPQATTPAKTTMYQTVAKLQN